MAAGAFVFPDKAKLNFFSATNLLGANTANFKLALVASSWTPANSTDEVFADVTGELATANGYTAGGIALTSVALTQTSGTVKFTAAAAQWTASGGSIPAWRRGVVYYSGTLNGKVNPIVGHFLGDSTPADVPATTTGNTLTVTPNASGILSAV
jgi:hypothetical protein